MYVRFLQFLLLTAANPRRRDNAKLFKILDFGETGN